MDLIKFPLLSSKIGCILNSQLLYHVTSKNFRQAKLQKFFKVSTIRVHQKCKKNWLISINQSIHFISDKQVTKQQ